MGRVAGSYGVRGWVKVVPDGGALEGLAGSRQWWIGETPYLVSAKVHGATVVAKPEGVATREEALQLKGLPVSVERSALPAPEEGRYYLADLVGLEVVNEQGDSLGKAVHFFSNGAQDVMEVQGAEKKHLVPWVAAIVKAVDLEAKRVVVEWEADW